MARATRRTFLGASALTALSGLPVAAMALPGTASADTASAAHPDAELIGLCAQIVDFERQWDEEGKRRADSCPNDPAYKASLREQSRLCALQEPILDRIYEMPTHTLDGFRARAKAIMAADYGEMERQQDHQGQLYSLMHDLVGEVV